ncbi:hypothetical protein [Intestinibacter sp.]|uniref:hypothetical protein n=1 Tax=Intestinibacter sp. TaxID=1965304 RepID=UPI003F1697EE
MSFIRKKLQLKSELKKMDLLNVFDIVKDDSESMVLRTMQNITQENERCLITMLIAENNPYNVICFILDRVVSDFNDKEFLLETLNNLNNKDYLVKYFINENNYIEARITYIADDENFDAYTFAKLSQIGFDSLTENYYDIAIWTT